jgi:hypothetical protein
VKRVIADEVYGSKDTFIILSDNNIKPAIEVKQSSSGKSIGCYARKIVFLQQKKDFENGRIA